MSLKVSKDAFVLNISFVSAKFKLKNSLRLVIRVVLQTHYTMFLLSMIVFIGTNQKTYDI